MKYTIVEASALMRLVELEKILSMMDVDPYDKGYDDLFREYARVDKELGKPWCYPKVLGERKGGE